MSKRWEKPHGLCEACIVRPATELHHKFHQVLWAKRIYGQLLHDERNLQRVCSSCHAGHAGSGLVHWSEREFCAALGIEPRSKFERGRE